MASARPDWRSIQIGCRGVTLAVGHAPSGAVLGASTAMALHSLCVIPQLVQQNRRRSPTVRGDQGSESIDDSSITASQTGQGRSNWASVSQARFARRRWRVGPPYSGLGH
jgi:hypothetical protein